METGLTNQTCASCRGGVLPLTGAPLESLRQELGGGWQVVEEHHIEKEFRFKDFREALAFTNRVGELAEAENHHPDIFLSWGRVRITLRTHKANGLTLNDFILAAKIDRIDSSA